ncbi:hypothetical protein BFP72_06180 [Reichenbachiella sp. 5M10]|uniref:hypothetical protein n=1 Tax=Reichenbachiella sp. 5M10 TaxID=1889772 RepID=UPI000C1513ED|nr:hypothetical protein [Reichenbachiella sp. 5M10]PIB35008.1 hypothetical protein BFP72_06180 [Reichenbachiella sp. 5M10]
MKSFKILMIVMITASLFYSCETDEPNQSTQPNIYQKFIGGAFDEDFVTLAPSQDGGAYILATKATGQGDESHYFLCKTDAYGNTEWTNELGYGTHGQASDMIVEEDRILTLGHMTLPDQSVDLVLWSVDLTGNDLDSVSIDVPGQNEKNGHFVKMSDNTSYMIAAEIWENNTLTDNVLIKVSPQDFDVMWSTNYNIPEIAKNIVDILQVSSSEIVWLGSNNDQTTGTSTLSINLADTMGLKVETVSIGQNNNSLNQAYGLYQDRNHYVITGGSNEQGAFQGFVLPFFVHGNITIGNKVTLSRSTEYVLYGFTRSADDNFLVSGYQSTGIDNKDMLVAEWTSTGEGIWEKVYENSYGDDIAHQLSTTADHIMLYGTANVFTNQSLTLMKTSIEGELF